MSRISTALYRIRPYSYSYSLLFLLRRASMLQCYSQSHWLLTALFTKPPAEPFPALPGTISENPEAVNGGMVSEVIPAAGRQLCE